MKKTIILFIYVFGLTTVAQNYHGGNADGHALATYIETQSIFAGGIADGFSTSAYTETQNIFAGGVADGFSTSAYTETQNIFAGGVADGFSTSNYTETQNIFAGGIADGFSTSAYTETQSIFAGGDADGFSTSNYTETQSIFTGGNADGFAMSTIYKLLLNPIAFLQGAYINPISGEENLMRDNLRVASLIPTTSPYADALTCNASVFTPTGNNAIVDWVWVELRDKNDMTNILASQSALLQRDGDIVATDGVSPLSFNIADDSYFVAVSHRTHLGILSANAIPLSASTTNLDLSVGTAVVHGGANAVVDLGNGKFALYAGDYDGNGQVQNTDLSAVTPLLGQPTSYDNADLDMNTQVQNTDINNLLNPNKGKGQQFRMINLKLYAKRKK